MTISDTTENAILNLVFRAVAWGNYADNAATTPETNIVIALHTADPTDSGTQSSSETTYTSYARVNVARTTGGWSAASGGSVSPAANIDFPTGTGGFRHPQLLLQWQIGRWRFGHPLERFDLANHRLGQRRPAAPDHLDHGHPGLIR
jgi:hypothetical protein